MKLELKHLDFVNNGKVRLTRLPHWDFENVSLQNCQLAFNGSSNEPYLRYKDVTFGLDQIKPLLRSLSQLTQEIEVDGVRFVPLVELKNYSDGSVHMDDWLEHMDDFSYKPHEINFEQCPYIFIQKLQEWHFDIYGLIEAGLAIEMKVAN
jgi:hypothetical protein